MKMRKVLSLLLAPVLLIALWPAVAPTAYAAGPYDLWVQGVQVTDSNKNDVLNDGGSVVFDSETSTLTLTNAEITGEKKPDDPTSYCGIYSKISALTLELVGKNTITCKVDGVTNEGIYADVLIIQESDKEPGVLTVTEASTNYSCYGICADNFTMRDGTLTVTEASTDAACYGIYAYNKFTMCGGTLAVETNGGKEHSYGIFSLFTEIEGGTLTAESRGAAKRSYGIAPYSSIYPTIAKGASVTALGQTGAFLEPPNLKDSGCVVTVNSEATKDGAELWNGTDALGGDGSTFRFVDIAGPLESITITSSPDRTEYNEGDFFILDGVAVTAHYGGGRTMPAVPLEWSPGGPLTPADKEITFSFTLNGVTKTTSLPITVKPVRELSYLELSSNPARLVYAPGSAFDPAGMVVTAHYLDGSTADVTGSAVITCDDPLALGSEVYVNYTEGGNTIATKVPVSVAELSYLEVTTNPARLIYAPGETFDPAGMVVTAHYLDGSTADVTGSAVITCDDPLALGSEVYVNYTEGSTTKSTQVPVTVTDRELSKIELSSNPNKLVYAPKATFDPAGMRVTAYFKDGSTADVTEFVVITCDEPLAVGSKVVANYTEGGVTQTAPVPVRISELGYLELSSNPARLIYAPGETFDPAGMEVTAHYLDGSTVDVTGSVVITCDAPLALGSEVYVNYTEGNTTKAAQVPVTVTDRELSRIELSSNPVRLNCVAGESFDPAGMRVTAYFKDGSVTDVTEFAAITCDEPLAVGSKVVVNYTEGGITRSVTVPVTVSERLTGNVSVPGSVRYTVKDPPADAVLIAARYNGGRMTAVKTVTDVKPDGTVTLGGSGTEYRLFLVNGSSCKPLCREWHS